MLLCAPNSVFLCASCAVIPALCLSPVWCSFCALRACTRACYLSWCNVCVLYLSSCAVIPVRCVWLIPVCSCLLCIPVSCAAILRTPNVQAPRLVCVRCRPVYTGSDRSTCEISSPFETLVWDLWLAHLVYRWCPTQPKRHLQSRTGLLFCRPVRLCCMEFSVKTIGLYARLWVIDRSAPADQFTTNRNST